MVRRCQAGESFGQIATSMACSPNTVRTAWARWREASDRAGREDFLCLAPRRPVPGSCPWALSAEQEQRILDARLRTNWGPMRLAAICGRHRSTVWKVLKRHGVSRRRRSERQRGLSDVLCEVGVTDRSFGVGKGTSCPTGGFKSERERCLGPRQPRVRPSRSLTGSRGLLPADELQDALKGLEPEQITGPGGRLTQLAGRVIETALGAELSEHLGYPPGQAPPGGAGNHRNGSTAGKTVQTESPRVFGRLIPLRG